MLIIILAGISIAWMISLISLHKVRPISKIRPGAIIGFAGVVFLLT